MMVDVKNIPFLGFLQVATGITKEFILLAKHFTCAELSETSRNTGILLNINGKIKE